jgi:hypothetical protein
MTTTVPPGGSHLRADTPIFHNLGWRDVQALLSTLGEVDEEPNRKGTGL